MSNPQYLDIFINQNASFSCNINIVDISTGNPINLTNYVVTSELKPSYIARCPIASFYTHVANNQSGSIVLSLPFQVTANLKPANRCVYDILLLDTTSNTIIRAVEGTAYIEAGVTSPYANNAFANAVLNTSQTAYNLLSNALATAQTALQQSNTALSEQANTLPITGGIIEGDIEITGNLIAANSISFINIPTSSANLSSGYVWRDANNFIRIV